jgi:peptidoglycan-associated lipoprotein
MTSRRSNTYVCLTILIFAALLCVSCKKQVAAAPPPPPPPAPAPPPAPDPVITLSAAPATIDRGQSTTLTWEARNAGTVTIEPGLGTVATSGNRAVNPASSVTYTATANGPGGQATAVARITVNAPAPPTAAPPRPPAAPSLTLDQLFTQNVQDVLFDYDQSEVRSDQVPRLQSNATWLKANPNVRFTIQGHADERGSQEYNLALGDRRANAVKTYLASQGVTESRMEVVSFGEERPSCTDQSEDCFQRNRRAAFVMAR